jgi:hypothetical protein
MQNTSHAVMAQRHEAKDSLDYFPTPPWATRALLEHVIWPYIWHGGLKDRTCLEPACGGGHMARVLKEYFGTVLSSDIHDYGQKEVRDFLEINEPLYEYHWIITNPPFNLAEDFVLKALTMARAGVAMLVRTNFLEGVGRYERFFSKRPPAIVAPFVERVPMVKGRVDPNASTATSYAWFVWRTEVAEPPIVKWIPPCRKALERPGDYEPLP